MRGQVRRKIAVIKLNSSFYRVPAICTFFERIVWEQSLEKSGISTVECVCVCVSDMSGEGGRTGLFKNVEETSLTGTRDKGRRRIFRDTPHSQKGPTQLSLCSKNQLFQVNKSSRKEQKDKIESSSFKILYSYNAYIIEQEHILGLCSCYYTSKALKRENRQLKIFKCLYYLVPHKFPHIWA